MSKEWFILIHDKQEGPYSIFDLKRDYRITPDTLVWRQGFPKWVPIRKVKELKEIFHDEPKKKPPKEKPSKKMKKGIIPRQELALDTRRDPPIFLIIILLILLSYLLYRLFFPYEP